MKDHLLGPDVSRRLLQEAALDGAKIKLVGRHPYRGRRGVVSRVAMTALGQFPVVELDDGMHTLLTHKGQFVRIA